MTLDCNGDVLVAAYTLSDPGSASYMAKYAGLDGAILWDEKCEDAENWSCPRWGSISPLPSPCVYSVAAALGSTSSSGGPDGLLGEQTAQGATNVSIYATKAVSDGAVIRAGSFWTGTNYDFYTAKYAGANGPVLWEQRYNGPANGNDAMRWYKCLAVAPGGAVIVAGQSEGSVGWGEQVEIAIVKYVESPRLSHLPGTNGYRVEFPAVPGLIYTLQRSSSPSGPWSGLTTASAPASGRLVFTDASPLPGSAFYRTVTP
jgi:hypothetical protein